MIDRSVVREGSVGRRKCGRIPAECVCGVEGGRNDARCEVDTESSLQTSSQWLLKVACSGKVINAVEPGRMCLYFELLYIQPSGGSIL